MERKPGMSPRETAVFIIKEIGLRQVDSDEVNWIEQAIQSALAERTEQCAKICDDRIAFVDEKVSQLENPPVWDRQGYHVHTYAEACRFEAATLAQKIRALNQENKS